MKEETDFTSAELGSLHGVPSNAVAPALLTYRSVGIGVFGAVMRYVGMPLEKIALYMNSSQVHGKGQFSQAVRLTFQEGAMGPYRVVGPSSIMAWFLQYSVMGVAFQFFDQALSQALGVQPVWYGPELMTPPPEATSSESNSKETTEYLLRSMASRTLSPLLAAVLESAVSNRAEVQRYFGPEKMSLLQRRMDASTMTRLIGPAFAPNALRNVIMCQTAFLLTPITYKLYFPQEQKSKSTLFWYGLGLNVFVGNAVGITQQALWGRSLDYLNEHGRIHYGRVIRQGLQREGWSAFFTIPKWFSRVLMNAPAQGTLPWFYNEVLPLGEGAFLSATGVLLQAGPTARETPGILIARTTQTNPSRSFSATSSSR